SSGFHPAPRISFGDALPLGVASEAELIDLEVTTPCEPAEVMDRLNRDLPAGVRVRQAWLWPRKGASPADSVLAATYTVPLSEEINAGFDDQLHTFLAQATVMATRQKKRRSETIDLRPWVVDLQRQNDRLVMTLRAGSPLFLAAYLLGKDPEEVRTLRICKTDIQLKDTDMRLD
ncbi:MAG: TIGR03936 family radical SAM-associated protein, partial [Desulfuromonadales bacterium]